MTYLDGFTMSCCTWLFTVHITQIINYIYENKGGGVQNQFTYIPVIVTTCTPMFKNGSGQSKIRERWFDLFLKKINEE